MVHRYHPPARTRSSHEADTPKRGSVGRSSSSSGTRYRQYPDYPIRSAAAVDMIDQAEPPYIPPPAPMMHYRETQRFHPSIQMANASSTPGAPILTTRTRPPATFSPAVITPTNSDTASHISVSSIKTQQKTYTRRYDWTEEPKTARPPSPESTVLTGPKMLLSPSTPLEESRPDDSCEIEEENVNVLRNDIIHIRVGTSTTVTHSRRKLRRSSPYFRKLLSDPPTDVLQLENANARDWHTLMEQYVLGSAKHKKYSATDWGRTSSSVLPDFLPWFVLLELENCLETADAALQIIHNSLPLVQSHDDAMDRLKICAIAKTAGLPTTMEMAFASAAKQFMDHRGCFLAKNARETSLLWTIAKLLVGCLKHVEVTDEEDEDEASVFSNDRTADEILDAIQHCDLFIPKSASLLCRAVFEYIPEECLMEHLWAANRSQLLRLLQNPLFPHLLRAGIIDDDPSTTADIPKSFQFMLWEEDSTKSRKKRPSVWLERIWDHLQRPPKLVAIPMPRQLPPRRFQC